MPTLAALGWAEPFQSAARPYLQNSELVPARVCAVHRGRYVLGTSTGELSGILPGRLRQRCDPEHLPVVGDWVLCLPNPSGPTPIEQCLPRRSCLTRQRAAGEHGAQAMAANLDTVFLTTAVNQDFNLRRLERYLALVFQSGAQPVVLLTKADLADGRPGALEAQVAAAAACAAGAPVHALSAANGEGLQALDNYLQPAHTVALLGSSGVGKSTLANALLGREANATSAIRHGDDRGRHTTTHRELFMLPSGAMLIDTPGMRELALWDAEQGLTQAFDDVELWLGQCRFSDCSHSSEPGCAVLGALARGELSPERYRSYFKLQNELAHQERQQSVHAQRQHARSFSRMARNASRKRRLERGE